MKRKRESRNRTRQAEGYGPLPSKLEEGFARLTGGWSSKYLNLSAVVQWQYIQFHNTTYIFSLIHNL